MSLLLFYYLYLFVILYPPTSHPPLPLSISFYFLLFRFCPFPFNISAYNFLPLFSSSFSVTVSYLSTSASRKGNKLGKTVNFKLNVEEMKKSSKIPSPPYYNPRREKGHQRNHNPENPESDDEICTYSIDRLNLGGANNALYI